MNRPSVAAALALLLCAGARAESPAAPQPAPVVTPPVAPVVAPAENGPLKLALSSPLGLERAREDAKLLAHALSEALHRPVSAEVVPHDQLPKLLATGGADLAWLSASQYLAATALAKTPVLPAAKLVRGGLPFYRSVIFTRASQKRISTPRDLKGKKLAFVSESSAAGYSLPRQILLEAGATDAELKAHGKFYGDHAAVCKAVLDGAADAGATFSDDRSGGAIIGCIESVGPRARELKSVATSDPIPNDVIALRPDASPALFGAVRAALLALSQSSDGKRVLDTVFHADAFVAADDGDFALLKASLH